LPDLAVAGAGHEAQQNVDDRDYGKQKKGIEEPLAE